MMSARLIVQCSESIAQHRFSDESFRLCDIQFDHPQIGVVAAAASPVIGDCLRLPGGANGNQRGRPVRADTAFARARVLAAILVIAPAVESPLAITVAKPPAAFARRTSAVTSAPLASRALSRYTPASSPARVSTA